MYDLQKYFKVSKSRQSGNPLKAAVIYPTDGTCSQQGTDHRFLSLVALKVNTGKMCCLTPLLCTPFLQSWFFKQLHINITLSPMPSKPGSECACFVLLFKAEVKIFIFLKTANCCFLELESRPWGRSEKNNLSTCSQKLPGTCAS